MNGLSEDLLSNYRQAKDIQIENLLSQYGTSLEDMRELYPQLTEAIKQRQLTTAFSTVPLFFTPSEAQDMGLLLKEGEMLKLTPIEGNGDYTSSLILPTGWEITEDDFYIAPTGERYSQADMQALLSDPRGGLTREQIGLPPLTLEDLTEEGKTAYGEYQQGGGTLDVAGWVSLQEQQQLETEQVFGKVFPEQDVNEVIDYINTNPEGFLADIREIGPTEDMVALLKLLEFTDEEIQELFATEEIQELSATIPAPEYIPESKRKDMRDALIAGGMSFKQGIETYLLTNPPPKPTPKPKH